VNKPNWELTPEEIRKECWLIQAEWSENERWRRMGHEGGKPPLTVMLLRDPRNARRV
jgi:hypothetical protein